MKIALAQTAIMFEQKEINLKKAEEYIKKAKESGALLILFPEMSFTGFSMNVKSIADTENETLDIISDMAKKYQINIGAGYVKMRENKGENHYFFASSSGEVLGDYIKRHPFSYGGETQYFVSGDDFVTVNIAGMSVSVQICFDLRFPGGFFKLAKDTHVCVVPSNWPMKRIAQYRALLCARAIENQFYVIGINCTGMQGNIQYNGQSVIYSPKGECVLDVGEEEGIFIYEMNDNVEEARKKFPIFDDRREDE